MESIKTGKIIKQISISIEKQTNSLLREKDITATQGVVLLRLRENEDGTMQIKELEKAFTTAQSTMFGIINRLEHKGFIKTFLDEKKNKIVSITEEGLVLCEYVEGCIIQSEKETFSSLTSTEYRILSEILLKIEKTTIANYLKEGKNHE